MMALIALATYDGEELFPDTEERLSVFDGLPVLNENLHDLTGDLCLNLVHELHRLDDAERIAHIDMLSYLNECISIR